MNWLKLEKLLLCNMTVSNWFIWSVHWNRKVFPLSKKWQPGTSLYGINRPHAANDHGARIELFSFSISFVLLYISYLVRQFQQVHDMETFINSSNHNQNGYLTSVAMSEKTRESIWWMNNEVMNLWEQKILSISNTSFCINLFDLKILQTMKLFISSFRYTQTQRLG